MLSKIEPSLDKKKFAARHYNKSYSGEIVYFNTKRLPMLKGEIKTLPRDYLFVEIDNFSRVLHAAIFPDKTQRCAVNFLETQ